MRKSYHKKVKATGKLAYRINHQITAPEIRIIDEVGGQLGVMPFSQALQMAQEKGFDLVEVFPTAKPPVVKLINYGQFLYQQAKQERKARAHQKEVEIKNLWLSLRIGAHDLAVRQKQALSFLENGDKVRIELALRGREKQHHQLAKEIINKFISDLQQAREIKIEEGITQQGGKIATTIANK
ncbi:MAG: translation initiation factor IF-3 [Candidatus Buchananbacteria bacterium]